MGLQDRLKKGTPLSFNNGAESSPNMPGSSKQSKLHDEYSLNGDPNIIGKPSPSNLDLDGLTPRTPNRDGGYTPINNTFQNGTYVNSAPVEGVGRI